MVVKVWVKLEEANKQPLSYLCEPDDDISELVERVLQREKQSDKVIISDVRVFYYEKEECKEVNFTESVSSLQESGIGSISKHLLVALPPKEKEEGKV